MAFHVLKQAARVFPQRGFDSFHPLLSWLRRNFRRRARVQQPQQQPAVALAPTMEALYALALAVVDEHGLD